MLKNLLHILQPYLVDGIKIILRLFLYVAVMIFLSYALLAILFPYPLDYGEAPLVDQARRLAAGQTIYRPDIGAAPYTIANYPPLYMLTLVPFANLSGQPFLAGRLISALSALATAIFLGLTVHTFTKDRFAAWITGMLFLAIPYVVYWSGLLRVDLLALAFSTAALYVLARWPGARWGLIGGGLLLVAAVYTRQSYALAAPLAAFAWLWRQERRRAINLAILVGGVSLFLFISLNILTQGGFFFNIITANINTFNLDRLAGEIRDLGFVVPILLLLAGIFIVLGVLGRNLLGPDKLESNKQYFWPLPAFYLLGAVLSGLTIGKIGSHINYFLELSAALSLVGGMLIFWSRRHPWRYAALLAALILQTGWLMQITLNDWVEGWLMPRRSEALALKELAGMLAGADGPILADEYMGLLTVHNRPLYLQPFEVTQLARAGAWDQTPLLQSIRQAEFPLILIYPDTNLWYVERWTPEMLAAIKQTYRPVQTLAGNVLYRPQTADSRITIPAASVAPAFTPAGLQVGERQQVGQVSHTLFPHIAVNPAQPDHLAVIMASASDMVCYPSDCQIDLLLYVSTDGGATWQEQHPFTEARQISFEGSVTFGPDNRLYTLGIRNGALTINWTDAEKNYELALDNQQEVTQGHVAAKPWLRLKPDTGWLYLSYASQYEDRRLIAPSLRHSADGGATWSHATPVDQSVSMADLLRRRATEPDDIQVLFAKDDHLALVWTWDPDPWVWPRDIWLATSSDGGEHFSEPVRIAETWGPINTATRNGIYYIIYRPGTAQDQTLAVAISHDEGLTWQSTQVSGPIALPFDAGKAPGIDVPPNGTIDVLFYAPAVFGNAVGDCALTLAKWQEAVRRGRAGQGNTCRYNVYYTFSQDEGQTFSDPLQLNETPIEGDRFVQVIPIDRASQPVFHLGLAATNEAVYPIWLGTQGETGTQAFTVRIER